MTETPSLLGLAADAARHAAARQTVIARNVANADTPGFQASDLTAFDPDPDTDMRRTDPRHVGGGGPDTRRFTREEFATEINGNSVSLEDQILRGIDAQRAHSRAITVYKTALGIMQSSLGRR